MNRRQFLQTVGCSIPVVGNSPSMVSKQSADYEPLGAISIPGAAEAVVGPNAETAYVAVEDGFAIVDISQPASPSLVATRTDLLAGREGGPLREILDVKVSDGQLLVAGPANAHDEPTVEGFVLYDLTDPQNPTRDAVYETDFPIHNAALTSEYAYLVNSNQVVIVDITDSPTEVGRWEPSDADPAWGDVHPLLCFAHDVFVRGDRAYIVEWDAGTFILDVSDPANPTSITRIGGRSPETLADIPDDEVIYHSLSLPGNHHTAAVNDDASLLVLNKEAWPTKLVDKEGVDPLGEVELWDITTEQSPTHLATIAAPDSRDPEKNEINTTPHNFDIAGDRLYTSWYDGGIKIHDISDPANPRQLAWWRAPTKWSFWTAQRATDEFVIASSHSRGEYNQGKGALVTFPNRAGKQPSPPPLTTQTTSPPTTSPTSTHSKTQPTTTVSSTHTTDTTMTDANSVSVPGFGVLTAVSALAASTWYHQNHE